MKKFYKNVALCLSVLVILGLTACGQGVENRDAPPEARSRAAVAEDVEVTYFRDSVYANIFRAEQCRDCHVTGGGGNGAFADDNVNTAFSAAKAKFNPATITFDSAVAISDTNPSTAEIKANTLVTKIRGTENAQGELSGGGHYCWGGSCDSAGLAMVDQLRAWVIALNNGGSFVDNTGPAPTPVNILTDPPEQIPDAPVPFDSQVDMTYFAEIYSIITDVDDGYCSRCHSRMTNENIPISPFFADTGYNGAEVSAYNSVVSAGLVNLNNPANSKLVVRPYPGLHNCGGEAECNDISLRLRAAITTWADAVRDPSAGIDSRLVPSKGLRLTDGQETSGGARFDDFVIAKYEFSEGSANSGATTAYDSSGVEPTIDLRLLGNVRWVGGYGLGFGEGGLARSISVSQSQKLHDLIVARGEYSIEAWVIPDNSSQTGADDNPSVIASYSSGTANRNFTLGQDEYKYVARNRISEANGSLLDTPDGVTVVQTSLQHVVMTYSETAGRKIYVNGVPEVCETAITTASGDFPTLCDAVTDATPGGALSQWDPGYLLTVGSDTNGDNQWLGIVKFLAIHRKALTEREIKINYDAGVGQKFNLLFKISHLQTDYPSQWDSTTMSLGDNSYIWFEVAEYDDYSYLFSEPKFIDLGYTGDPLPQVNFSFRGIRIGVNGKEAAVGQAFTRLGKSNDPNDDPATTSLQITGPYPASLTRLQEETYGVKPASGTIIPKDIDVNTDQFFLTFEWIGGIPDGRSLAAEVYPFVPVYNTEDTRPFVVGMRTFDEINETMSALTGVSTADVFEDDPIDNALKGFGTLKGQLPSSENISGFLPSQQTAIASLAGRYCHLRVENSTPDGRSPQTYFNVSADFFNQVPPGPLTTVDTRFPQGSASGSVTNIINAIINNMVRDVDTLDIGLIEPELRNLAGFLLEELAADDTTTQPHQCDTAVTPDCSGSERVKSIVKAMCTAVLASAVVTEQ
jgi:hypothetical protein